MVTKKTTNVTKKTVSNEQQQTIPVTDGNETKILCPVCGSEFAIGAHEHQVKNATVIGADSGLGNVYLTVSKRGDQLQAAGIDPTRYFSINLPTGGEQLMKMDDDGKALPVMDDDPVLQAIRKGGTVPNRSLFRRWVMSQVFHGLNARGGFSVWLRWHGYDYQWKMLIEELRVQAKLYGKDMENYTQRNRWFNKALAVEMAEDYIEQLREDAKNRPQHKCKGVPYVTVGRKDYFVSDIDKKLIEPFKVLLADIQRAKTPMRLYETANAFWHAHKPTNMKYKQSREWKDAYRGMGAYATMQNLLRFHGCRFPKNNEFYCIGINGLSLLERAAMTYQNGGGWRLFGLMKQMIDENGIDIEGKMLEWSEAKKAKHLRR